MSQYRQGDILIEAVDALPEGARATEKNPVFAYGEVTGHCHRLDTDLFERWDHDGIAYMKADVDAAIKHEEHGEIPLKSGVFYRVSRQRQFDPILSIPKPVID